LSNPDSRWKPFKWLADSATPTFDPGVGLALLLALFVVVPLLRPGLPATADTPIHFYRTLEFGRSWTSGMLYPRWAPDFAYGYGLPFWNFTPPLPYVLVTAIHALGLSLAASLKLMLIAAAIGYMVGAYLLVRDIFGPAAGLVAAAAFGLSTFALRESLLYGGNLPQYMAVALFPWLLWSLARAVTAPRWRSILAAALFYAAIILCHQFHALVISPVALGYAIVVWIGHRREWRSLTAAAAALLLGLGLSCFFWLPALLERQWTRATESTYLNINPFHAHFLSLRELTTWPPPLDHSAANPWLPFTLYPLVLLLALVGMLALLRHWRHASRLLVGLFFLSVLGATVFLLLPASEGLWYELPFLALAQFPWRLLGVTTLALSALAGAAVTLGQPRRDTNDRGWVPAVVAVILILFTTGVYLHPFQPFIHYGPTLADMTRYEVSTRNIGMTTLGEYVPKWVQKVPTDSPFVQDLIAGRPVDPFGEETLPPGASAALTRRQPNGYAYQIETSTPFSARFRTFFFPGWEARINGRPTEIGPEAETGFITADLPAGTYVVELKFAETPLRRAANGISIAAFALTVIITALRLFRREPPAPSPAAPTWPLRPALAIAIGLAALLLFKSLYLDQHTTWFYRKSCPGDPARAQHLLQADFGQTFRLVGYDISSKEVSHGQRMEVVLYWQKIASATDDSTNYRTFVHLDSILDERTWAASDHAHPGDPIAQIELPTTTWDTDHYVRDRHILDIGPQVPPINLTLTVGIYDPDANRRLPIDGADEDTFMLDCVQVQPGQALRAEDISNHLTYHLGPTISLLGYDWDPAGAELTLFWRSDQAVDTYAVIFVHLLDAQGNLAWGADSPPLSGIYPTTDWLPGRIVADPRHIELDNLPSGAYTVSVGMYEKPSDERLPVKDAAGQDIPTNSIPLFQIEVD
jgi:hypothetical protein